MNKIITTQKKQYYSIEDPDKLIEYINDNISPNEKDKKKYGEVFTPIELVEEMLYKLPNEVWSNPHLRWLDPAVGIGNFPIIAYLKLMDGLKEWKPNEEERRKYILENMLYMVEINNKNIIILNKLLCCHKYKLNIHTGDFLESDLNKIFGIDKFDIIMGNPPFQEERDNTNGTTAGRKRLYMNFITSSLNLLKQNGYLVFLNPSAWRGMGEGSHLWNIMSKKQLLYLNIYGKKSGHKFFNVGSRFDLYVLQNKDNNQPTEIIDELEEQHFLNLNEWDFFPNYNYKNIKGLLTTEENGIDVIWNSYYQASKYLKENKEGKFILPVIHTITQKGIGIRYSCENKGHFGIPKVILNFNEHQYSHPEQNDWEGRYGMSQISFGIPISSKKEGELILKAFDTPQFKEIIASTKWGAFQTDYRMFKFFKKDWYKYFISIEEKTI